MTKKLMGRSIVSLVLVIAIFVTTNAGVIYASSTGKTGPQNGFTEGKTVNKSRTQDMATVSLVATVISKITKLPTKWINKLYAVTLTTIAVTGTNEIFYERTKYTSPDGFEYYYKYNLFLDQAHNDSVGETIYSSVYGNWAR